MRSDFMVTCLRCNRALSDPQSVARGYGPVCALKLKNQRTLEEIERDEDIEIIKSDQPSDNMPDEVLESQEELYKTSLRARLRMQQTAFVEHRRSA